MEPFLHDFLHDIFVSPSEFQKELQNNKIVKVHIYLSLFEN